MSSAIKSQAYGKARVRVLRVVRHPDGWQELVDYSVRVLLSGDQFESSYTAGDNRLVVATDSQKNIVYYLAKTLDADKVMTPERFAAEIAEFMVKKYDHVTSAQVHITTRPWERQQYGGRHHPHAFTREGKETRWAEVVATKLNPPSAAAVTFAATAGFYDLEILKTTNSSFVDFYRDEFATLPDMADRIVSTNVDCKWRYVATSKAALDQVNFGAVYAGVKSNSLDTFSNDTRAFVHASVQTTLYMMADRCLKAFSEIDDVYYALPNNHVFPVDLSPFGLKNLQEHATVYNPIRDPSGYITGTISRKSTASKL
ncbi:hypothetical protein EV182_006164 [Spiromyces aspiralis]|uniref:Uncharacterized protein n=1 Tax=Spiromyces aspiralis TaxID=68401 RepID=A0ACC1HC87_9FUNG|nr:hypothetical protein EV182_006164 [Spiromyces aspiralis]